MTNRPRLVALLVAGAFFMEFLDGTVIATAIPQMAVSFGVRPAALGIGMSAYLLTLAVLLPLSGWVADRFGPRRVFSSALAVFTVASLLCAVSTGLTSFVLARILQGAGGAMMVPVGRLVVLRTTAKADLMRAIATLTWPALTAPLIAPPLGGFITTYASWHWVFLINLPFGVIGLIGARLFMPETVEAERRPLDWLGLFLTGGACLSFMAGIEMLGAPRVDWAAAALLVSVGIGLGVLAVRSARRHPSPLLDYTVLHIPSFAMSIIGGSIFRMTLSSVPFLLPLFFQIGLGYDAFHSGLMILALFLGNIMIKPATAPILRRFGFRPVLIGNGLCVAATITGCALVTAATPVPLTLALLFAGGVARSLQFTAINTIAFSDVPPERISGANSLFNMLQQISVGMGIALGVVFLRLAQMLRSGHATGPTSPEFHLAFVLVGLIALVGVIDAVRLPRNAGQSVGGR